MDRESVEKHFWTTKEAATFCCTTPNKIRALIDQKVLPAIDQTFGAGKKPRWLVPVDAVRKMMQPTNVKESATPVEAVTRKRIDEGLPRVFG
jgi:hypothetical protein